MQGWTVVLDGYNPPQLANLTIDGVLEINTTLPVTLRAGYIRVRGQLLAGTRTAPLTADAVFITLRGSPSTPYVAANGPEGSKVLFVDGGLLSMVGTGPYWRAHKVTSTVVPAAAGSRTPLLLDPPLSRAVPGDKVRRRRVMSRSTECTPNTHADQIPAGAGVQHV